MSSGEPMTLLENLYEAALGLAMAIGAGTLGMYLFPAFLLLSLILGFRFRQRLPHSVEIAALVAVFLSLFAWQAFFLFGYPSAPNQRTLVVAGWEYTPQALSYLERYPALAGMTWETRAIELMSAFQARPELVWTGAGLTASRIGGGLLICAFIFLITATIRLPSLRRGTAPPPDPT